LSVNIYAIKRKEKKRMNIYKKKGKEGRKERRK
jgi:hypothetical protein